MVRKQRYLVTQSVQVRLLKHRAVERRANKTYLGINGDESVQSTLLAIQIPFSSFYLETKLRYAAQRKHKLIVLLMFCPLLALHLMPVIVTKIFVATT